MRSIRLWNSRGSDFAFDALRLVAIVSTLGVSAAAATVLRGDDYDPPMNIVPAADANRGPGDPSICVRSAFVASSEESSNTEFIKPFNYSNAPTLGLVSQQSYFKASNTGANDNFGFSVAVSDNTVVVGAPGEASNATGVDGDQNNNDKFASGAAYVYFRDGTGNWSQQAYLKASNTKSGDQFGWSVAVSGDTVVVGARFESSNARGVDGDQSNINSPASGAAYVFVRDLDGNWSQQAYLKASNTGSGDQFGWSVAVSGDTVVVGAHAEDSNATGVNGNQIINSAPDSGAAYVFVRDEDGNWSQQAYLKASNTDPGDQFGISVAASGDNIVVGAFREDGNSTGVNGDQGDNGVSNSGAAYVFVRDEGGGWSQQAYLKASNSNAGDEFGESVAVSGDTVVVGAHWEDSNATGVDGNQHNNSAPDSGAAYVFVRDENGNWSQQAYLKASNTGGAAGANPFGDQFGESVAVSGDTAVVGAPFEDSIATGVNGDQDDNSANRSGAVYVFVRDAAGDWSQAAYLKASNANAADFFGNSVGFSSNTVVAAAWGERSSATGVDGDQSDNSTGASGAAYLFVVGNVCSADVNGDDRVDLADFAEFQACFGPTEDDDLCYDLDCNGDGFVDLFDFGLLSGSFTGPTLVRQSW